jgi:hypothetical protein
MPLTASGTTGTIYRTRNATSTAYEASRVVSNTGPVVVYSLDGYNSNAAARFIQLHDAASLPSDGAAPVLFISVPASSNFALSFGPNGRTFAKGCVICNSTTGPTKTIGTADFWFDVQYD